MTEEEKKAIDKLKSWKSYMEKDEDEMEVIDTISNLIEKLQKDNEELREITNGYNSLKKDYETFGGIPLIIADEKYFNDGIFTTNFIPKDKIRKKIEELENGVQCYYEFSTGDLVDLLKILLEEE